MAASPFTEKRPKPLRLSSSSPVRGEAVESSIHQRDCLSSTGRKTHREYLRKNTKVAIRATVGYLLLSLLVFIPSLAEKFPYSSLIAVDYIIIVTFGVEELEFGFVSEGAVLSSAAQLFGSLLGALGAVLTQTNSTLTLFTIFLGTALFTSLHGDNRLDMITSTGELNFVFNLLGSRTGGTKAIWLVFCNTMLAALVAHGASILVSILCFPRLAKDELRVCMKESLLELGASLSAIGSVLVEPYIEEDVDFGDSSWKNVTRHDPSFLLSCVNGRRLEFSRQQISRARKMSQYLPYEPNLFWFLRCEPQEEWNLVISKVEDLLDEVGALHSVLHNERRRYFGDLLEHWPSIVMDLKYSFAQVASECYRIGDFLYLLKPSSSFEIRQRETTVNMSVDQKNIQVIRERAKIEYLQFLKGYSDTFSFPSTLEMGPFMFVLVMADSIRKKTDLLNENAQILYEQRKLRSFFRGSRNFLGWARILTFPFERWTFVLKNIPLDVQSFLELWESAELRFCLKKWIGEMVILVVVYYGWLPRFFSRWNGLLIWMAFVLYIQPTLEGTLVGALANLLGVFFGALIGGLLMSFPFIAMNALLLDTYLMISTFIAAYFINSTYSLTILNTIITQYVVILGQYNPLVYEAHWYVPIGRCIMMSMGTIVAVFENEYLWPHSIILQIRYSLASCLNEMSSIHSQLLNLAFRTSLEGVSKRKVSASYRFNKGYQTIPQDEENTYDEDISLSERILIDTKRIGQQLEQVQLWLDIVSGGFGGEIYGVPSTLKTMLATEKMLRERLVAFASLLSFDSEFIDLYWRSIHERFFKLSSREAQLLREARHSLVHVIISCILADAASVTISQDTFTDINKHGDAWRSLGISKKLEDTLKQEPLTELNLDPKHVDFVRQVSKRILSRGSPVTTPVSAPSMRRHTLNRSVSYSTKSSGVAVPSVPGEWFRKERGSKAPFMFTVVEDNAVSDKTLEERNSLELVDSSSNIANEEDDVDNELTLTKQVGMVWEANNTNEVIGKENSFHSLEMSKREKASLPSFLPNSWHFLSIFRKYFYTDWKAFKGVGEAVIKTVQSLSPVSILGTTSAAAFEEEPVIVTNLERQIDLFREAQGRFFLKYMELEVDFYRKLVLQSFEKKSHTVSSDDRVLYNLYEIYSGPSFTEKHIFFLSIMFIASYTADGLKEVAKELLKTLEQELLHLKRQVEDITISS
ncbi:hypothetical protein GpartN1_g3248.t1 [Galdieria partita]|uniref:Integral membrane bound transporter domain-containing protein n=1 Tax=Galdieria partita TaxID=83374 RepID=A0A9C7PXU3_9RHOD|nr:hypothetical protein GpartN1_g3248.t1 [Galdieria partita]